MVKSILKWGCIVIIVLFIIVCVSGHIYYRKVVEPEIKEIVERNAFIKVMNEDLPRKIGTIGILDSVGFEDNSTIYYLHFFGNYGETQKKNYNKLRESVLYQLMVLNAQNGNADRFIDYCIAKNEGLKRIETYQNCVVEYSFTAQEMKTFFENNKLTPTEALLKVLRIEIEIISETMKDPAYFQSVTLNSIKTGENGGTTFIDLEIEDNQLIATFAINENYGDNKQILKNFIENKNKSLKNDFSIDLKMAFAKEMVNEPDIKEFVGWCVLGKIDLTIKYIGIQSKRQVDITIPHTILKLYSNVPLDIIN